MGQILESCTNFLVQFGYLPSDHKVTSWDDIDFTSAVAKFQRFDANATAASEHAGRSLIADGVVGPATFYAMSLPRCGHADSAAMEEPLIGSGGWRNCHGIEDGHKAIAQVYENTCPSHIKPHLVEIMRQTQRAYAQIGLLWIFVRKVGDQYVDMITEQRVSVSRVNVDISWERGKGWIGLAIVGTGPNGNQQCTSKIWAKFDTVYNPRSLVREQVTLWRHELGHCSSLQHSRGGVMNPSIVNGLAPYWTEDDPSTPILKRLYGGVPIEVPGGGPGPQPPGDDLGPGKPFSESFEIWDGSGRRLQIYVAPGGSK